MNSGYRDESGFISKEGSNNWVISAPKRQNKYPILANDPHRAIKIPSLRYIVHLQAPGWNVIEGGEPSYLSIHRSVMNHGAWGLTIFSTDMKICILYKLNPQTLNQYNYKGHWISFCERSVIPLRLKIDRPVCTPSFQCSRSVTAIDSLHHVAYAIMRVASDWMCSPPGPRMDQSKTWTEFRNACSYSFLPAETWYGG